VNSWYNSSGVYTGDTIAVAVAVAISMVASDVDGSVLVGAVDQIPLSLYQWPCLHHPWPA
jgi:hypothetical protein